VIVWEYTSTKAKERIKEAQKHEALQQEAEQLQEKLHALDVRLQALERVVKKNTQSILNFGERYVEPEEVKVKIDAPLLAGANGARKEEVVALKEDTSGIISLKVEPSTSSAASPQTDSGEASEAGESKDEPTRGWWGWLTGPFRKENTKS